MQPQRIEFKGLKRNHKKKKSEKKLSERNKRVYKAVSQRRNRRRTEVAWLKKRPQVQALQTWSDCCCQAFIFQSKNLNKWISFMLKIMLHNLSWSVYDKNSHVNKRSIIISDIVITFESVFLWSFTRYNFNICPHTTRNRVQGPTSTQRVSSPPGWLPHTH